MAKFKVQYANGDAQEVEQSDCRTVEQFMNCRFGSTDTSGVKVELIGVETPAKQEIKPAHKKAVK